MRRSATLSLVALLTGALLAPLDARAHCDGVDGPVVGAARAALAARNVDLALVWIQPRDEPELRQAFARTLAVRALGDEARALADRWFYETTVRLHRAGEGAAYTGLAPAGRDPGPAVRAADRALRSGRVEPLLELLDHAVNEGTRAAFTRAAAREGEADVAAGRRRVAAYVAFVPRVEAIHAAATGAAHGAPAAAAAGEHDGHAAEP